MTPNTTLTCPVRAVLLLISVAVISARADVEAAKQYLAKREFAKAFAEIEPELGSAKASIEALAIGSRAGWESGQTISAARAVTLLLQKDKDATAETYYLGAEIARSVGDNRAATARYSRYAQKVTAPSPELKSALKFVLATNPGLAEYSIWDTYFRKDPSSFGVGVKVFDDLLAANREEEAVQVMGLLLKGNATEAQAVLLGSKIDAGLASGAFATPEQSRALLEVMKGTPRVLKEPVIRRLLDRVTAGISDTDARTAEQIKLLLELHQHTDVVHPWAMQLFNFENLKDKDQMNGFAKQFLALGPAYRKAADPEDFYSYLGRIYYHRTIGPFRELHKQENAYKEGAADIELLISKFGDSPERIRGWINDYADNFLDNDQWLAFFDKHIRFIDGRRFERYCQVKGEANLDASIALWQSKRTLRDQLDDSDWLFKIYRNAKQWDKALAAIDADYRAKGNTDIEWLLRTNEFDADKVTAMILKWIEDGGDSKAVQNRLADLKTWRDGKGAPILAANKEAKGKMGADPLLSALVLRHRIQWDGNGSAELDKAVEAAAAAIGTDLSMRYEDVRNLKDFQIQRLCEEHANSVYQKRDKVMKRVAPMWFPRIAIPGEASHGLISRFIDRGAEYSELEKELPRWFATGKVSERSAEPVFRWVRLSKGSKTDPMAAYAKEAGPIYLDYLMNGRGQLNNTVFATSVIPMVIERLAKSNDSAAMITMIGDTLYGARGDNADMASIVNLAKAYLAFETRSGIFTPGMVDRFLDSARDNGRPEAYEQLYPLFIEQAKGVSKELGYSYQERFATHSRYFAEAFYKSSNEAFVASLQSADIHDLEDRRMPWNWAETVFEQKKLPIDIYPVFEKEISADHYYVMAKFVMTPFLAHIAAGADQPVKLRALLAAFGDAYSNEGQGWNNDIPKVVEALEKKEQYQLAYAWIEYLYNNHAKKEEIAASVNLIKGRLSRFVPGLVPVEKGHPHYDIYLAQEALAQGSTGRAWELIGPSLQVYLKDWDAFGIDMALFVADRLRNIKRFDEAKLFCQTILLQELSFDATSMGTVNLIKADIYRDTQNFQAARVSYQELVNNGRFRGSEAAKQAKLRLIDLLLLTQDTSAAGMEAQRLVDANDMMDQAEGFYYLAQVATAGEDFEQANEYLKEVFKRNTSHNKAKLLKGELRFHIRAGLSSTEIDMGTSQRQEIAVPGRELVLKLQDANLAIARAGQAIPVVVTTSIGKDEERVRLMVDQEDPTLFKGTINTALGDVKTGNLQLEIRGEDIISYQIDPEFQKANALQYEPKQLVVKASGRLIASSGEILSQKEQEERELSLKLEQLSGASAKEKGRNAKTIRPGSPIYVQVADLDQDTTDQPDALLVTLVTNTGDILEDWPVKETGPHTGVFRSAVPTGAPAPMARASDSKEGTDAYGPINSNRNDSWESLGDGKAPKWYEIDTMSSHAMAGATITMPDVASIKRVRLVGYMGDREVSLGEWPASTTADRGGLQVVMRNEQRGESQRDILSYLKQHLDSKIWLPNLAFNDKRDFDRDRDFWRTIAMDGVFWLEQGRNIDFKLLHKASPNNWQTAHLLIDGKVLVSGQISAQVIARGFSTYLESGPHTLQVLMRDHSAESAFQLGYKNPQGEYVALPDEWFATEKNPKLAAYLNPKGVVNKTADGFAAEIRTEQRFRSLRWVFEEFTGASVSVSKALITNAASQTVIPVAEDFTTGRSNMILEVGPGDDIEVTYEDGKRLDNDPPKLQQQLDATYFNALISLNFENLADTGNGHMRSTLYQAKRIALDDQLLVRVEDWDEDLSDKRDTIKVMIRTTAGEQLELELNEFNRREEGTAVHSGVFQQILTMGSETKGTTIKVVPGDTISLLYTDKENTDPGVPAEREYTVNYIQEQAADFHLLLSSSERIEDRSERALEKVKLLRQRGDKRESISMFKTQISAARVDVLKTANLQVPLLFNLTYPAGARHEGSVVTAEVLTSSELDAAKAQGREPVPTTVALRLQPLAQLAREKGYDIQILEGEPQAEELLQSGIFAGLLRFQLGTPGDQPDTSVKQETSNGMGLMSSAALQNVETTDTDRFIVPTVVVKGSDRVNLLLKNSKKEILSETSFALASDGRIGLFDPQMVSERPAIHLGQFFQVQLVDADQDTSDELDEVSISIAVSSGQKESWKLKETLPHSGIFTAAVKPEFMSTAVADAAAPATAAEAPLKALKVSFGDTLQFSYTDAKTVTGEPLTASTEGVINKGFDGDLLGFSKRFQDPEIAVRTQFLIAEAMFEMAKDHRKLKKDDLASEEISTGKRVLEEALRDYPNTDLKAQGEYLLANLAQELEKYEEAIGRYAAVISAYPKSEFASKSQFKKALCLEKLEQHDSATEEYVRLTYLYPTDELVADATVRLGNYYYMSKDYKTAARIFEQFQHKHPEHELAIKALFLSAQSHIKREAYTEAGRVLSLLIDSYPDDVKVRPEAMYWKGDCAFRTGDHVGAYRTFKKLTWDYPSHEYAKIARGRLTEDVFSKMSEQE